MDKIRALVEELRKKENFHELEKEIKSILKSLGIIENAEQARCDYLNKNTDDCAFVCQVEATNLLGKKIDILIKPDHAIKRVLRVMIQVEGKVFEDKANVDRSDEEVFDEEADELMKTLKRFLRKQK